MSVGDGTCERCHRATLYGRHLYNKPCRPWWFDGEPHVAHGGRVYCPHCSTPLGMDMDRALARSAFHDIDTCKMWSEGIRRDVANGEWDEALARGERTTR